MSIKINPQSVATKAVKEAVAEGVSVERLKKSGVTLLMKQLKTEGILPKSLSPAQLDSVKMALALAIEQLASNTQPASVTGGVTA